MIPKCPPEGGRYKIVQIGSSIGWCPHLKNTGGAELKLGPPKSRSFKIRTTSGQAGTPPKYERRGRNANGYGVWAGGGINRAAMTCSIRSPFRTRTGFRESSTRKMALPFE